jgi:hypothetical protein
MARQDLVSYNRSFLSPDYMDNLFPASYFESVWKQQREVERIRKRDPEAFEEQRQALAQALKVDYRRGTMVVYRGDQGGRDHWEEGVPSDAKVAATMEPTNPPQRAVISPVTGSVAMPFFLFGFEAYVDGQSIHKTVMYRKLDQDFEAYATPWELLWSALSYPYDRGFTPIVNRDWEVIGYMGQVETGPASVGYYQKRLIIPSGFAQRVDLDLPAAMRQGIPLFVHGATGLPNGWSNWGYLTTEDRLIVRTTIDGQVVNYQTSSTGALEHPWYSPFDLYAAGKVMVTLGKAGIKLASSYVLKSTTKYEARVVFNGATETLAKETAKDAAKDATTSGVKQGIGRALGEADLRPLARLKGTPSRVLSSAEMETFLKDVMKRRPYLAKLRGVTGNDDLFRILKEWEQTTGKSFLKVSDGAVQRLGSEGVGGWALDTISGKEVLIIEGKAFRSEAEAAKEVLHELAYEAVREGPERAIPHLNLPAGTGGMRNAMQWLEAVIQHGDGAFQTLRSMGQPLRR